MSSQKIETLHEQASEHYLNGRFVEALETWQELLRLDPDDERAQEGVRLASLSAGGQSHSITSAPEEVEGKLDPPDAPSEETPPPPDPTLQDDGIDWGDSDQVVSLPLAEPAPDEPPLDLELDIPEPVADPTPDPFPDPPPPRPAASPEPAPTVAVDPVEAQLKTRVAALIGEARQAAEEGEPEKALGILSRVAILDEESEEARSLEQELRQKVSQVNEEIERWMTEGVQWLEDGRVEEAVERFKKVLERVPGHMEAESYMERAHRQMAQGEAAAPAESGLPEAVQIGESPPGLAADPLAESFSLAKPIPEPYPTPEPVRIEGRPMPDPAPGGRRSKALLFLVFLFVLAGGAAYYLLKGNGADGILAAVTGEAPEASPPSKPDAGALHATPAEAGASGPSAPAAPVLSAAAKADKVRDAMARASRALESGDNSAAILAYNEALSLDPNNAEARAALFKAGESYRREKTLKDEMRRARLAFEDGEYSSALRMYYRLPSEGVDRKVLDRYKFNGWYNMAVIALRAGDIDRAMQHLDEALSIRPDDAGARKMRSLAERYDGATKDRTYYGTVENLRFRKLED